LESLQPFAGKHSISRGEKHPKNRTAEAMKESCGFIALRSAKFREVFPYSRVRDSELAEIARGHQSDQHKRSSES
jgi:hypothetical protein